MGNTLTISLLKHTIRNICLDWVTVSLMLFVWFFFTLTYGYTLYKFTTVISNGSRDVDTFWPPGLTPSFVREIWTLSDHQVTLPVSFERYRHFLSTWSHSQFCSRLYCHYYYHFVMSDCCFWFVSFVIFFFIESHVSHSSHTRMCIK